jgi:hypothetical protein
MGSLVPLDRVTALPLDPGATFAIHGLVRTSLDGSVFDVAWQSDGLSPGHWRTGGLFDLAAGGLRISGLRVGPQHPDHEYTLTSTGPVGPACVAAGLSTPCLVPRTAELAHERLQTVAEFASTLSGGVEMDPAVVPPIPRETLNEAAVVGAVLAVVGFLTGLVLFARRRARTALGRVRAVAREALRLSRGDLTLEPLGAHVRSLVDRATQLDVARGACLRALQRIDRKALEHRAEACARSNVPEAAEALQWLTAERAEAARLESDLAASVVGLERIESALRVVVLRARESRFVQARAPKADPVDDVARELELREEGLAEAARAIE